MYSDSKIIDQTLEEGIIRILAFLLLKGRDWVLRGDMPEAREV